MKPGLYSDIPEAEYHADPFPISFSASIGSKLINDSPWHAWAAHPRMNPNRGPDEYHANAAFGTAMHAAFLGRRDDRVVVLDCDDWMKKAMREARDEWAAKGFVPITRVQSERLVEATEAARDQLAAHKDVAGLVDPPKNGRSELTCLWERDGHNMRSRIDWLAGDNRVVVDYKTTTGSAHPSKVQSRLYDTGADLAAAHYLDGLAYHGIHIYTMHYVIQEVEPPYLLSVVALDGEAMGLAQKKLARARFLWDWCMRNNRWPAYPTQTAWIGPPGYERYREEAMPIVHADLVKAWEVK